MMANGPAAIIREFATDKHKTVDDTPYGGGAGMVLKADVLERASFQYRLKNVAYHLYVCHDRF